ncbi:MAG: hypothetical protein M3417_04050 [Actinomycetota bacterium]|nr:hypothetical protein [Actinomycetota bacterium]
MAARASAAVALTVAVVAARMSRQSQADSTSPTQQSPEPNRVVVTSPQESVVNRSCA